MTSKTTNLKSVQGYLTGDQLNQLNALFAVKTSFPKKGNGKKDPYKMEVNLTLHKREGVEGGQWEIPFNIHQDSTTGAFDLRLINGTVKTIQSLINSLGIKPQLFIQLSKEKCMEKLGRLTANKIEALKQWKNAILIFDSMSHVILRDRPFGQDKVKTEANIKRLRYLMQTRLDEHEQNQNPCHLQTWIPWLDYITDLDHWIKVNIHYPLDVHISPFSLQRTSIKVATFIEYDNEINKVVASLSTPFTQEKISNLNAYFNLLASYSWDLEDLNYKHVSL